MGPNPAAPTESMEGSSVGRARILQILEKESDSKLLILSFGRPWSWVRVPPFQQKIFDVLKMLIGLWCNGNMTDFDSVVWGSSPHDQTKSPRWWNWQTRQLEGLVPITGVQVQILSWAPDMDCNLVQQTMHQSSLYLRSGLSGGESRQCHQKTGKVASVHSPYC